MDRMLGVVGLHAHAELEESNSVVWAEFEGWLLRNDVKRTLVAAPL
jgi:hypothetical protein